MCHRRRIQQNLMI